jgi:hypothetical protein
VTRLEVDFAQFDLIVFVTLRSVGDEDDVRLTGDANVVLAFGQINTIGFRVAHVDHDQNPAQNMTHKQDRRRYSFGFDAKDFAKLHRVFI